MRRPMRPPARSRRLWRPRHPPPAPLLLQRHPKCERSVGLLQRFPPICSHASWRLLWPDSRLPSDVARNLQEPSPSLLAAPFASMRRPRPRRTRTSRPAPPRPGWRRRPPPSTAPQRRTATRRCGATQPMPCRGPAAWRLKRLGLRRSRSLQHPWPPRPPPARPPPSSPSSSPPSSPSSSPSSSSRPSASRTMNSSSSLVAP
mmetsp:Transcript_56367/g.158100  ORF Transcript_56367/g.158100 Transcript_56367/m.158100 type:complete len:202 (+) Transcript_56367:262-867(+)